MSVYTTVETAQLEQFLLRYELGKLLRLKPIVAGITNTNYQLDTEAGEFVLTLYEHHSDDELEYLLGLQGHLASNGVHCAAPIADRRGAFFSTLNQRPAAIIERLNGEVVTDPDPEHCRRVALELGRFHMVGQSYPGRRNNPRGLDWMVAARDMLNDILSSEDQLLIDSSLQAYRASRVDRLPRGAIHADLFHDNALFIKDALGGIFDFDYACTDSYVFDLAVLVNDWCIDRQGELEPKRLEAVLHGYAGQRRPGDDELENLPLMLQVTALRFWLSRLYDQTFPLSGELTFVKSPDAFRRLLVLRRQQASRIADLIASCAPAD